MRTLLRLTIGTTLALLLVHTACDNTGPAGSVGDLCNKPGFYCATAACAQFPTTPGCTLVKPDGDYCPFDTPTCFDPRLTPGYCDAMTSACAMSNGMQCPTTFCSLGALQQCNTTTMDLFCSGGYACKVWSCMVDGGTSDGAMVDGATHD